MATTARKSAAKSAAKATPRKAVKKTAAPRARSAVAPATLDTLAQLRLVKAELEGVSVKLNGIDPDQLDAAAREQWSHQMDRVDLAIARARNAVLRGLVQAFEAEVPAIQAATGQLAASLERLNQAAQVIEAVAGVLGVIEKVITLGR